MPFKASSFTLQNRCDATYSCVEPFPVSGIVEKYKTRIIGDIPNYSTVQIGFARIRFFLTGGTHNVKYLYKHMASPYRGQHGVGFFKK